MQDPLCFSAQSGQSLIPDPGVNAGSFSVPVSHLPGPEIFLSFLSSCVYYITFMVRGLLLLTAIFLTRYEIHSMTHLLVSELHKYRGLSHLITF